SRASRSMLGVATVVLPYAPTRSARSVSMVISKRWRAVIEAAGAVGFVPHAVHNVQANSAAILAVIAVPDDRRRRVRFRRAGRPPPDSPLRPGGPGASRCRPGRSGQGEQR